MVSPAVQRLATRRQDLHTRRGTQDRRGQQRAGGEQMLAVVKDQQERPGAQVLRQRLDQWMLGSLGHAEGRGDRLRHERLILQRRKLHKPDAIGVAALQVPPHLQRQARLARAARSRERQQPRGGEQRRDLATLALATDEAGELARQVSHGGRHGYG